MGERIAQREIESRFRGFVELFDALDTPIVPGVDDHNVYLVREDLGRNGSVWREVDAEVTDLETVITDLLTGQYKARDRF